MQEEINPYQSPPEYDPLDCNDLESVHDTSDLSAIRFQSGHTRAVWAIRFLWLVIAVKVITGISVLFEILLLSNFESGNDWQTMAEFSDMCQRAIVLLLLASFLASAISFIMWFHRAAKNLPALGSRCTKYSPGWTIGAWFVPILNLFRPYQIMVEVWHGSSPDLERERSALARIDRGSHVLVGWWWAAWITMSIINQISSRLSADVESLEAAITADYFAIIVNVVAIPAALLAIFVIKTIDSYQELRYKKLLNLSEEDREEQPWM